MPQTRTEKRRKVLAERQRELKRMHDELANLLKKNPKKVEWTAEFEGEVPPLAVLEALAQDGPFGLRLPNGASPQGWHTLWLTKSQEIKNLIDKLPVR